MNEHEHATPTLIQLEIGPDPSFPRRYRQRITKFQPLTKAYTDARGAASHRRVDLTFCPEAVALAAEIIADFPVLSSPWQGGASVSVQTRHHQETRKVFGTMFRSHIQELPREKLLAMAQEAISAAIDGYSRWWLETGSQEQQRKQAEQALEVRREAAFDAARNALLIHLQKFGKAEVVRGRFESRTDEPTRIELTFPNGQRFKVAIDDVDLETFSTTGSAIDRPSSAEEITNARS